MTLLLHDKELKLSSLKVQSTWSPPNETHEKDQVEEANPEAEMSFRQMKTNEKLLIIRLMMNHIKKRSPLEIWPVWWMGTGYFFHGISALWEVQMAQRFTKETSLMKIIISQRRMVFLR